MTRYRAVIWIAVACLVAANVVAQTPPAQKSLSATLEVYVFPKAGQDAARQSKDEAACYDWATKQTGTDPFHLASKAQKDAQAAEAAKQQAAQGHQGAGARGAVGGAAAGALIGEIASDDAGKGAAWGAAIGGISARRNARRASEEQKQQIDQHHQANQQATAHEILNFKKAFAACLEAKDYMVKY